ncbi:MAG: hypothetical protein EAZ91_05250 [Cytophagales bacterium]|nr:MAG: hypothetical protein EAZ91_05250 [Cytophagales bacterium]
MIAQFIANIRLGRIDARTLVTYRNVAESFLVKGLSVLIGFVAVPLTLRYIAMSEFGIWMTITSLASWFSLVDVSFGNGLRNSLVAYFGTGDNQTARQYVSTTYALSGVVALVLIALIVGVNCYTSWCAMFNIETANPAQLDAIITYTLIGFSVQLFLKPVNAILLANQRAAFVGWILLAINALTLICLYAAMQLTSSSLLTMAHIYTLAPLVVYGVISLYLFSRNYAVIAPRLRSVRRSLTREMFSKGGQFFVLQLISVLVFTAGGLFISYFVGSGQVGPYSIVNKYFGVVIMLYGIVITPYWSAFTDAYTKNDRAWIVRTMGQLNKVSALMVVLVLVMLLAARIVLPLWLRTELDVSTEMLVWTALYTVSYIYLSNYNSFVNGVGQIKGLVIISVVGVVAYIALVTFMFRYAQLGPVSVVLAGTAWNSTILFVCWRKYRKLVRNMPSPNPQTKPNLTT